MKERFLFFIFFFSIVTASAGVDLRSGNFYLTFYDLALGNNSPVIISRFYNSQSNYSGMFGFRWSSNLETKINVSSSGELIVREYGGGAKTYFSNDNISSIYKSQLERNISIVAELKANEELQTMPSLNRQDRISFYTMLYNRNRYLFEDDYVDFVDRGLLTAPVLPDDIIFSSSQFGYEIVTKTPDGFKRLTTEGTQEYFNKYGDLTQIIEKDGNRFMFISYDTQRRIIKVSDQLNNFIEFHYASTRREVSSVKTSIGGGLYAVYKYSLTNGRALLYDAQDIAGKHYSYEYSFTAYLKSVQYPDQTSIQVEYDDKTNKVTRLWFADGSYNQYSYFDDRRDPELHFTREVEIFSKDHNLVKKLRKEFKFKKDEYNHLLLTFYNSKISGPHGSSSSKIKGTGLPLRESIEEMLNDNL